METQIPAAVLCISMTFVMCSSLMKKNQYIVPETEVVRIMEEFNIPSQYSAVSENMDPDEDEGW